MRIILLSLLLIISCDLVAQVPDVGDNTVFSCVEIESADNCTGDIFWEKKNKFVGLEKATNVLSGKIKRFRLKKKQACNNGASNCIKLKKKLRNFRKSKSGVVKCSEYSDAGCDGIEDVLTTAFACTVASSPFTTPATSSLSSDRVYSRIANGLACRSANNSPVLAVLFDGFAGCTASLITPDTVITAAHCLEDFPCNRLSLRTEGGQVAAAENCFMHPSWSGGTSNDVGIVTLRTSITGITPVNIHTSRDLGTGELVVLSGYGDSEDNEDVLKATLNYISSFTTSRVTTFYQFGQENIGTTCVGDSGSPLFIYRSGQWKTIGTLSGGGPTDCLINTDEATTDTSSWANLTDPDNVAFINSVLD